MNSNNNLENIYKELGKDVCLFPFFGGFYQTHGVSHIQSVNNTIRPCSLIKGTDKWKVIDSSLLQTRNTESWKNLRKNFIEKSCHDNADCLTCSQAERSGGNSPRILNNQFYVEHLSIDIVKEIKHIIKNDYQSNNLVSLDFFPSSYCNYECIMCSGIASSKRWIFERKLNSRLHDLEIIENKSDKDFYDILNTVEVINFTGGETIMQKQAHELMDYLIKKDLAKNIIITLLTNASAYPNTLIEKFKLFKNVFYTISIDGIGDTIEYQRRGSKWKTVEKNALKLLESMGCTINYVLTAVNVFSILDFISWLNEHKINDRIFISLVFNTEYLSIAVIPPELRESLLNRLQLARSVYTTNQDIIDRVLEIFNQIEYQPSLLPEFIKHIKIEDNASKKTLAEVVPEWAPYFK